MRATRQEEVQRERLERLDRMVQAQNMMIGGLEDLIRTITGAQSRSALQNLMSVKNEIAISTPYFRCIPCQ